MKTSCRTLRTSLGIAAIAFAIVVFWPKETNSLADETDREARANEPRTMRSSSRASRPADQQRLASARLPQSSFEVMGEALASETVEMDALIDTHSFCDGQRQLLHARKGDITRMQVVRVDASFLNIEESIKTAERLYETQLPAFEGGTYPIELYISVKAKDPTGILPGSMKGNPDSIVVLKSHANTTQALVGSKTGQGELHYYREAGSDLMFITQTNERRTDWILGACDHEKCGGRH